jgi:hypothetical protein
MARNKIDDLRDHLFDTIERLKDEEAPMDIERAKAIATVAETIIASAKVEVDYLRVTGAIESDTQLFKHLPQSKPKQLGEKS